MEDIQIPSPSAILDNPPSSTTTKSPPIASTKPAPKRTTAAPTKSSTGPVTANTAAGVNKPKLSKSRNGKVTLLCDLSTYRRICADPMIQAALPARRKGSNVMKPNRLASNVRNEMSLAAAIRRTSNGGRSKRQILRTSRIQNRRKVRFLLLNSEAKKNKTLIYRNW